MKKRLSKKLQLNRETLRHLSRDELAGIAGASGGSCPTAPQSCCYGTCIMTSCGYETACC